MISIDNIMDERIDALEELFADEKAILRPLLADVVSSVERLLLSGTIAADLGFRRQSSGPEVWSWADVAGRVVSIGTADLPGAQDHGHPYFQITHAVVPVLGGYLTTNNFVLGKTDEAIASAFTAMWVNHHGAYNGILAVAKRTVAGGSISHGIDAVGEIAKIGGLLDASKPSADYDALMGQIGSILTRKPNDSSN